MEIYLNEKQKKEIIKEVLLSLPLKKEDLTEKIKMLRRRDMTYRQIGKVLGISRQTVLNKLRE